MTHVILFTLILFTSILVKLAVSPIILSNVAKAPEIPLLTLISLAFRVTIVPTFDPISLAAIESKLPTVPVILFVKTLLKVGFNGIPPVGPVILNPEIPVGPVNDGPVLPVAPVFVENPEIPVGPVNDGPVLPVAPVFVENPEIPVGPIKPVGPVAPLLPVAPVFVENPGIPCIPVGPIPVGPVGPNIKIKAGPVEPVGPVPLPNDPKFELDSLSTETIPAIDERSLLPGNS